MTDQGGYAAGWYPNPDGSSGLRWYDGERWTDDYHYEVAPPGGGYEPASMVDPGYQSVASEPPAWYTDAPAPGLPGSFGAPPTPGTQANYIGANRYKPPPKLSPMGYVFTVLTSRYADFTGRARRSEFWWFWLFDVVVTLLILVIGVILLEEGVLWVFFAWTLATFLPRLAVMVRRLHDTNKSGWTALIGIVPFGGIVLLIFMLVDGDLGPNQYGYPPK